MGMCKVYKEKHLVLRGQKNKGNIFYLDGQALKKNHESKVMFPNVVKVLGDIFDGRGVCSLSN